MNFGRIATVVVGALLVPLLASCGGSQREDSAGGAVRVVATYSILGDLVENVGGEGVESTTLVGPNSDAHTFEPAPSDNAELAEADIVFENGLEFETWLDDLYESSGSGAERAVVTRGLDPLPIAGEEHGHEAEDEHAEEHETEEEHGEYDPHVWHDPTNAVVMVEEIRDTLVEADPGNAGAYRSNAERYISELEDLDAGVTDLVDSIPGENRTLFTSHDTFGYFAERYGFEVDTALASVSTETSDPSAGETAGLVREIERSGVPAIFAENVSNPTVMQNIADEAGVELAPTLYTDALGELGSGAGTYVGMVRHNARTISGALGG
ncbi:metal ABC transporter substrate-binding protein [Rubrobacter tropicus]|uniref:Metal ABC transporter substrate-binding protein n=1 Tax=Rubrobacter tropicus TaxID=2653851 RepID=A0A6G8QAU9_9ACTN|nr:zinc ABC transporter substrate-binding protein [Rubrobacter tropicus]QIN83624.1 metal ABC transporter substrate-binding protein [Rubrobacter tropicus]